MDVNSSKQALVELRIELKELANAVTDKHAEIAQLNIQREQLEKIKRDLLDQIEEDNKKHHASIEGLAQRRKEEDSRRESSERERENIRREVKEAEKTLHRLNNYAIVAKDELKILGDDIREKTQKVTELDALLASIPPLKASKLALESEISVSRTSLSEINNECLRSVRLRDMDIAERERRVNELKLEEERLQTSCKNLREEIVRNRQDIAIYIARARQVYTGTFPELEMKLI